MVEQGAPNTNTPVRSNSVPLPDQSAASCALQPLAPSRRRPLAVRELRLPESVDQLPLKGASAPFRGSVLLLNSDSHESGTKLVGSRRQRHFFQAANNHCEPHCDTDTRSVQFGRGGGGAVCPASLILRCLRREVTCVPNHSCGAAADESNRYRAAPLQLWGRFSVPTNL